MRFVEVARAVGFANESHLSHRFKQLTGERQGNGSALPAACHSALVRTNEHLGGAQGYHARGRRDVLVGEYCGS